MDVKDQIRSRLPIEQLVSQYCQLKKKGRNFVCLCPFHSDKNPSFLVSPDKGIAYCFACQSGGDIFSFYQKIESVDFPTAVRQLAEKAGVEIPKDRPSAVPTVSKDEKQRVKECLAAASAFYRSSLAQDTAAMQYVRQRGCDDAILARFQIGYAPQSFSATYEHLLRAGFSRTEIVAAGLGVQNDIQEQRVHDRFRHRIMFPITDAQGAVIGFGGRTIGDDDAKYINSPESIVYHKSSALFGFSLAREAMRRLRSVVLVEGYFDVVASQRAGVDNVVAVSGTALTEDHVRILKRSVDTVILCLDQDHAGQRAALRAFDLLARADLRVHSVTIPAKDPDELVQRDAAAFLRIIAEDALPFLDAMIQRMRRAPDAMEPEGKRRMMQEIFPLLEALPSSVELRAYLTKLASSFGMVMSDIERDFSQYRRQNLVRTPVAVDRLMMPQYSSAELCLSIALLYPASRSLLTSLLPPVEDDLLKMRDGLLGADLSRTASDIIAQACSDPLRAERCRVLALYAEEQFSDWSDAMAKRECGRMVQLANKEILLHKQREIVQSLHEARNAGRKDEEAKLLHAYQSVLALSRMSGAVRG